MEHMNNIGEQTITCSDIACLTLKEQRVLRKKQKKDAKKLQKQKEQEQREIMFRLQPVGNNVTLITRDFANKVTQQNTTVESYSNSLSALDFPTLGEKYRGPKLDTASVTHVETRDKTDLVQTGKKYSSKLELSDFISVQQSAPSQTAKHIKPSVQSLETYCGNPLDSDLPVRKKGKYRETPKIKKASKLKQGILQDKSDFDVSESNDTEAHLDKQNLLPLHCDHLITGELNDLMKSFVSAIVLLQEKLYKRDPMKGTSKRRYVVGLHECKKYLKLNKVKIFIVATDIRITKHDGALSNAVCEAIELTKTNEVPYLFALKRRVLGVLTMKCIPVSCIAILNIEGLEDQFNKIIETLHKLKNDFKINKNKGLNDQDTNTQLLNKLIEVLKECKYFCFCT